MANKVLIKRSAVQNKNPITSDLSLGELALNTYDGNLFFKKSPGGVDSIVTVVTLDGTQTLTNKTLTSPTITGALTLSDTTASTSTTTGALKIGGGLGVVGSIYADQIRLTNNGSGTNVYLGDDVVLGDINVANTLGIRGNQDSTKGYIVFGSSNNTNYIGRDGTNPLTVTGQFAVNSGTVTGANAIAFQISGYANKGGTGYHDFLSVTNSYATATNPNKFFRLNSTGNLEIINSAYNANIFTLTDAGVLSVPAISAGGTTGVAGQVLQSTGSGLQWANAGGNGTVTSIVASTGLTGGTITSTGTIAIDTSVVTTLTGTQTLTNKTLTSPTINSGALSGTFTGAPTLSDTTASTSSTTGSLKLGGGLGVAGNIYVGSSSKVGYVNASNVSAVYQYYNAATNSLDTVFG